MPFFFGAKTPKKSLELFRSVVETRRPFYETASLPRLSFSTKRASEEAHKTRTVSKGENESEVT
jgi:hypothetical protein